MPSVSLPSLATVAEVASVGGAVVSGIGAFQQSQAAAASAGYNSALAARNAQIATQNAAMEGAKGEAAVATQQAKTRAEAGALLAQEGASGVDINKGSSLGVRESQAEVNQLNATQIRSNAAREAYNYQVQSSGDVAQSKLYKSEQSSDKIGGYLNAGSTVIGGLGKEAQYTNWLTSNDPTSGLTLADNSFLESAQSTPVGSGSANY